MGNEIFDAHNIIKIHKTMPKCARWQRTSLLINHSIYNTFLIQQRLRRRHRCNTRENVSLSLLLSNRKNAVYVSESDGTGAEMTKCHNVHLCKFPLAQQNYMPDTVCRIAI